VFRSETPIPLTIPAGESRVIELVMTNRVGGRYAQGASFFLSVGGVLVEKSITLEGQAAPDPNPQPEAEVPAENAANRDGGDEAVSSTLTSDDGK